MDLIWTRLLGEIQYMDYCNPVKEFGGQVSPIVITTRKVVKKVVAVGKAKGNLLSALPLADCPFPIAALRGNDPEGITQYITFTYRPPKRDGRKGRRAA